MHKTISLRNTKKNWIIPLESHLTSSTISYNLRECICLVNFRCMRSNILLFKLSNTFLHSVINSQTKKNSQKETSTLIWPTSSTILHPHPQNYYDYLCYTFSKWSTQTPTNVQIENTSNPNLNMLPFFGENLHYMHHKIIAKKQN